MIITGGMIFTGGFSITSAAQAVFYYQPEIYSSSTVLLLQADKSYFNDDVSVFNNINTATAVTATSFIPSSFTTIGVQDGSAYFGGTTSFIASSNTIPFGTNNFTIEAWIYPTVTNSGGGGNIYDGRASFATTAGIALAIEGATNIVVFRTNSNTAYSNSIYTAPINVWTHVALVKISGIIYSYVNGNQSTSLSYATSLTDTALVIGKSVDSNPSYYFQGYISNLRVIHGRALYTGSFTTATQALTLTPSPLDDSNYSINLAASSYVQTLNNTNLVCNTADFTVECWFRLTDATSSFRGIWAQNNAVLRFGDAGFGNKLQFAIDQSVVSSIWSCAVTGSSVVNTWNHVAWTRSSGANRLYLNGVLQSIGSGANPGSYPNTSFTDAGSITTSSGVIGNLFIGQISNVRVVNGYAVYSGSFTPPTNKLTTTQTTGTSNILPINSSVQPYSVLFNGSTQYLQLPAITAFNFGTNDFTIEMWVYITAGTTYQFLLGNDLNSSSYMMVGINVPVSGTQTIAIGAAGVGWPVLFGNSITFASNTWYHVAITRSGTTNRAFINGVQLGANVTDSTSWTMSNPRIGMQAGGTNFGGYISNLRIVNGLAVYTGSFSPPTNRLLTTQSASTNISAITNAIPSYSISFNGTNQYLTLASIAALTFGAGDFTVECWLYLNAAPSGTPEIFNAGDFHLNFRSGTTIAITNNSTVLSNVSNSIATSTWIHIAAVRVSGAMTIYLNGVGNTTAFAQTYSFTQGTAQIATQNLASGPFINGYISDLRVVNGIAVYTGNFSPPTAKLTAISGTALLIAQSSTIVDTSVNAFTITAVNSPLVSLFNPRGYAATLLTLQDAVIQDNSGLASTITNPNSASTSTQNPFGSTALLTAQESTIRDNSIYAVTLAQVGGPSTTPLTPFGVTTLLTLQNNGSIDNNIIENFARIQNTSTVLIKTGTATPGTFSPFSPTNWSAYFNGSSDYLISTGTFILSRAFTVEAWVYATALTGVAILTGGPNYSVNMGFTAAASDTAPNSAGAYLFIGNFLGSWSMVVAPTPIVTNTWYHVAGIFDGYATSLYINGVLVNTGVITWNVGPMTYVWVGRRWDLGGSNYWAGYISNLRITDNVSLYATSNSIPALPAPSFIVPTSRLTTTQNAGTNIAAIGSTSYSYYFNGSQYLIAATLPLVRTNAFTMEVWLFPTAVNTQAPILSYYNSTGGFRFFVAIQAAGSYGSWSLWTGASTLLSTNTGQTNGLHINKWTHLVVQRDSANLVSVYINGVVSHYATLSTDWTAGIGGGTLGAWIGGDAQPYYFTGYMSNFRFTLGTALYTGTFNLPTTAYAVTQNASTNILSLAAPTYSNVFNGSSQYLSAVSSTQFVFGVGVDFTVEAWVYPLAYGGTTAGASIIGTVNGAQTGWSFNLGQDINTFRVISNASGSWTDLVTASTGNGPSLNVWTHLAFVRSRGTLSLYKNGTQVGTPVTGAAAYNFSSPNNAAYIGYFNDGTNVRYFNGYISNARVVKGVAVYTGTFTPPTAQLTTTQSAGTNIAALSVAPSYSYSFNGTNQYLTIAQYINWSTLGPFTLETWIYFSSIAGSGSFVFFATGTGASGYTIFYIYGASNANAGSIGLGINGTNEIKSANSVIAAAQWYHVAYTYDGVTTTIYVNGASVASATTAVYANNSGTLQAGSGASTYMSGYMSNIRLTQGVVVYTGSFTPPTSALTTTQSSGTNISAITSPVASFSYNYSGSNYLSAPITAAQFGSSNWTVEGWVYLNSIGSVYHVIGSYGYSSVTTRSWVIYIDLGGTLRLAQSTTGSDNFDAGFGTPTFAASTWYHVAVVRNGATITAYRNGVALSSTQTPQTLFVSSAVFTIGTDLTNYLAGYISNLRIVKGIAVYTGRFTPQNSPLTAAQATGNNISAITSLATAYAYSFNGSNQYLSVANYAGLALGTGDFTVEFWMNATAVGTYVAVVGTQSISGAGTAGMWRISNRINSVNGIYFNYTTGSAFTDLTFSTTNYNDGAWHHVAACRASGTLRMFVDGVSIGTPTAVAQNLTSNQALYVGYQAQDLVYYTGYVSNLRIVKGVAVYTGAFAPPTAPLTTTQSSSTNIAAISSTATTYSYSFTGANYIQVSNSTNFAFSNKNFTIEFWVYFNSVSTTSNILGKRSSSAGFGPYLFWLTSSQLQLSMSTNGSSWDLFSATALLSPVVNTWYHVAVVRNGYSFTSYINGAGAGITPLLSTATTNAVLISPAYNTNQISIGGSNNAADYFNGYISNVRIVNGIAVYTGNFTVPNAPLATTQAAGVNISAIPSAANTVLLTAQNTGNVTTSTVDNSIYANVIVNNASVAVTNTQTPFFSQTVLLTGQLSTIVDTSAYGRSFTNTNAVASTSTIGPFGVTTLLTAQSASIVDNSDYGRTLTNTNAVTAISTAYPFITQTSILTAQSNSIVDNSYYARAIYNTNSVTAGNTVQPFVSPVVLLTAQTANIVDSSSYGLTMTNTGVVTSTNAIQPLGAVYLLTAQSAAVLDTSSYVRTLTTNTGIMATSSTYQPLPVVTLLSSSKSSFLDSGSYAWPSATVGSPIATPQSALLATDAYNVALNGSSIYFAGASNYLTLTQQPEQFYMTGAFTFETWIYPSSSSGYIFGNFNNQTGANSWYIGFNNANALTKIYFSKEIYGNGAAAKYANTPMPLNQWNHLAIGRDTSSTWFILLNGASYSLSTSTSGTTYWFDNYSFDAAGMGAAATSPLNINGIATSAGITGYYSDMRFVNGLAIYNTTTNLGPPTQPLTLVGTTQTVLLLNGRPGGIIDSTGKNNITTAGGAKISQAVYKYGTGSLSFNGSTDYIFSLAQSSRILTLSTSSFTVEFWIYSTALTSPSSRPISQGTYGAGEFLFLIYANGGFDWCEATTPVLAGSTIAGTFVAGSWQHVAITRNGTAMVLYVNGVYKATATSSYNYSGVTSVYIGGNPTTAGQYLNGYMDDVRITTGVARYTTTATFTPPTAALSTGTYIQIA
jgi:hypothetical protein